MNLKTHTPGYTNNPTKLKQTKYRASHPLYYMALCPVNRCHRLKVQQTDLTGPGPRQSVFLTGTEGFSCSLSTGFKTFFSNMLQLSAPPYIFKKREYS